MTASSSRCSEAVLSDPAGPQGIASSDRVRQLFSGNSRTHGQAAESPAVPTDPNAARFAGVSGTRSSDPVVAAVALAVTLAGCGGRLQQAASPLADPASLPVGASTHTMPIGGLTRSYIVYRPAALPAAAPLVVMMHGGFGRASQAEKSYHWNAQADAGHFLVAYPDGQDHAWNAGGGCCGIPAKDGTDDIGFITAMISATEHAVPVDAGRIYATGISNGGIMAYDLACHTRIFAAIGPDSATLLGSCPDPAPLSVIAIHGTADHNIPYSDGPGHIDGPSVPAVNAAWRAADHYAPPGGHHRRHGDHLSRPLPRRPVRGAHHHRRSGPPVARRRAKHPRPEDPHRSPVHRARRHGGHLALLRRPSPLTRRVPSLPARRCCGHRPAVLVPTRIRCRLVRCGTSGISPG
jgi:polyhydroxybutyrate depolymerase